MNRSLQLALTLVLAVALAGARVAAGTTGSGDGNDNGDGNSNGNAQDRGNGNGQGNGNGNGNGNGGSGGNGGTCTARWGHWGIDYANTRYQPCTSLSPHNVQELEERCRFAVPSRGLGQSQATIEGESAYVADKTGYITRFSLIDCSIAWRVYLPAALNISSASSRNTGILIDYRYPKRDQIVYGLQTPGQPRLFSLYRDTGALAWVGPKLDAHPAAILTASGVYVKEKQSIYLGVSSFETTFAYNPAYPCCSFAGSFVRVSAADGSLVAKRFTTDPTAFNPNGVTLRFPGNAVWGSSAAIDLPRNAWYLGTGDNYFVSAEMAECVRGVQVRCNNTNANYQMQRDVPGMLNGCVNLGYQNCSDRFNPPTNLVDSMVSLDLDTLSINWKSQRAWYDAWNLAFFAAGPHPNRPDPIGPDSDFGQGPIAWTFRNATLTVDVISAGQKSGEYHVWRRDNGQLLFSQHLGTGGNTGGFQWGSARDPNTKLLYATSVNSQQFQHVLLNGSTMFYGSVMGIKPTLALQWEEADPGFRHDKPDFSDPCGAVSAGGGLVFTTSLTGWINAFRASDGALLWQHNPQATSIGSGVALHKHGIVVITGYTYRDLEPSQPTAVVVYRRRNK